MPLADTLMSELERESGATRTALSRVPDDKLAWKPHEKSMSLGQLAQHIATLPGGVATLGTKEVMAVEEFMPPAPPENVAGILKTFDQSIADAKSAIGGMPDEELMKSWTLTKDGRQIMSVPRLGLYRNILLNHLYHHRGQLTVYLRLLDVPVPSIYGPSADENPFG